MNYKIIREPEQLKKFIDLLPETEPDEKFYVSLFARRKYAKDSGLKSDKGQLKRFLSTRNQLSDKIWQLEAPVGSYRSEEIVVPQESLVVYMNPNPRSMRKAASVMVRKIIDLIDHNSRGYNIVAEALSAVQQSKGNSPFIDFDFDTKDTFETEDLLAEVRCYINREACKVIWTRGGFHLLVTKSLIDPNNKIWYNSIAAMPKCDVSGDSMVPIPGCVQGGYIPTITDL